MSLDALRGSAAPDGAPDGSSPGEDGPPRFRPALLIGCPILHRDWILKRWWLYAVRSANRAGFADPEFVFVGDPLTDPATYEVVDWISDSARSTVHRHDVADDRTTGEREWNWDRYERMVDLRNTLLGVVRELQPDHFLSLDSDILLHPDALANYFETLDRMPWGAVGGKAYLSKLPVNKHGDIKERDDMTHSPSWANLTNDQALRRQDADGVFPCDVIMAIKLMTPEAYNVDYATHGQGEDTGWSKNCHAAGVRLGHDGRVTSKHIMDPTHVNIIDPRCGY